MPLNERLRFLRSCLSGPGTVGAVAPSSRKLAQALCDPFRRCDKPATVLEIGAGTGAVTRHIGSLLGPNDELDICEIDPEFVDILENKVLSTATFAPAVRAGRVRVVCAAAQAIPHEDRYDFIISGLPLTAFSLEDVEAVLGMVRRALKPGAVFSYFEYVGLRKISRTFSMGKHRARLREVSPYLNKHIRTYEFDQQYVIGNLPPAVARHLRYTKQTAATHS